MIAERLELDIRPGDMVFFAGPSGSGKSSLLQATAALLPRVVSVDDLRLPKRCLADALPLPIQAGLELLGTCGLAEARLLVRTPEELSEGERHRFRLALGIARLQSRASRKRQRPENSTRSGWLMADEFTAKLDRTTAKVVAFNLRRLADRIGVGFLLAGAYDDILADLDPDLLVRCELDAEPTAERNCRHHAPRDEPSRGA